MNRIIMLLILLGAAAVFFYYRKNRYNLEKKMGQGFASMIFSDCSPTHLPPQFGLCTIPGDKVSSIFNQIIALRIVLVTSLTYVYFGVAGKAKADKVIDSFYSSMRYSMLKTGNYTEAQINHVGINLKESSDKYRVLFRGNMMDLNPKDISQIFLAECGISSNQNVEDAVIAVFKVSSNMTRQAYQIYYAKN